MEVAIVQISNDAFYYLKVGEPCLDEDNLEEALDLLKEYPCGFVLGDEFECVENSDLVEVALYYEPQQLEAVPQQLEAVPQQLEAVPQQLEAVPQQLEAVPQQLDFDEYQELTNYEYVCIKWLDKNTVKHFIVGRKGTPREGLIRNECICTVYTNKYKLRCYETDNIKASPPSGMLLFLNKFKPKPHN